MARFASLARVAGRRTEISAQAGLFESAAASRLMIGVHAVSVPAAIKAVVKANAVREIFIENRLTVCQI